MAKILIVAPELAPLVSVGGIAEYALGLATSLLRRGHEVRAAIPFYAYLRSGNDLQEVNDRLVVRLGVGASEVTAVHEACLECPGDGRLKLPAILIGEHRHFASVRSPADVYQWPNHEPWIAFSRAIIDLLDSYDWRPDVIHCQDAHTSLIPVYVKQLRREQPQSFVSSTRTVLTIHNLRNQALGTPALVSYAGFLPEWFQSEGFEFYGRANCFKAGLLSADRVSTVSRTYAREMCETEEFGFGLEGVLRHLQRSGKVTGIVNGIDQDRWKMEGVSYDGTDSTESILRIKESLRQRLYPAWQWRATHEPVIALRSRWDEEKGLRILGGCIDQILAKAKVVMRVWGTPGASTELRELWTRFRELAERRPNRFLNDPPGINTLAEAAAHYAIADFFMLPSRYEPCGLTQMECQRYGTIPIVRQTGGLADTVSEDCIPDFPSPNGFVFKEPTPDSLLQAVERAVEAFYDPDRRERLIQNTLRQQNGWDSRVEQYEALFGATSTLDC
jgi:starch synthase